MACLGTQEFHRLYSLPNNIIDEVGRACNTHERVSNTYKILV
jgi:hypothetical protein